MPEPNDYEHIDGPDFDSIKRVVQDALYPMKTTTQCDACGDYFVEGDWPFCVSPRNPEGHKRGAYAFNVAAGGGALKKWTHTGSRSPR